MMKLTTLWMVDRTVDSTGRSPVATELFRRWSDDGEPRMLRTSANFVYMADYRGEPCFLRFAHASERSRDQIEQEMRLLGWLDRAGLPVNLTVPSRAGQLVETVETDLGEFHAVLLTALPGVHLSIEQLAPPHFDAGGRRWGGCTPALTICPKICAGHRSGRLFSPPLPPATDPHPVCSRGSWRFWSGNWPVCRSNATCTGRFTPIWSLITCSGMATGSD